MVVDPRKWFNRGDAALTAEETCPWSTFKDWSSSRSFELTCRPAPSLLRYRADPRTYSADVNFLFLAFWQIGSLLEECDSPEGGMVWP